MIRTNFDMIYFYFKGQYVELDYNHLDFLWAKNVRADVYDYLIEDGSDP